ncbi:MAG: hypothetical protein ABI868_19350 [Acidobacteriota bacterium]
MAIDWITRLADDERKRDETRQRGTEAAARKADLVRIQGQRLLDALRATVARDIAAFRLEFPGDGAREITLENGRPDGGFVVRKPQFPTATLDVAPRLDSGAVGCQYRFIPTNGLPAREDRIELGFIGDADATLAIKHHGTGQVFANADDLSEYLLLPVFTGRPR